MKTGLVEGEFALQLPGAAAIVSVNETLPALGVGEQALAPRLVDYTAVTSPALLAAFAGTGVVSLPTRVHAHWQAAGVNSNVDISLRTTGDSHVDSVYNYAIPRIELQKLTNDVNADRADQAEVPLALLDPAAAGSNAGHYCNLTPTALELVSFRAVPVDDAIELRWRSALRTGTLGFHVLRGATPSVTEAVTITVDMVMAELGAADGAQAFTVTDADAAPNVLHDYRLAQIELSGRRIMHGPVTASSMNARRAI